MPASILNDGPAFFPNVISDQTFQLTGVLTATEGRVSWGVIDPRRHAMTIWEKSVDDFVDAALARNASLISNAPFLLYDGGAKSFTVARYGVHSFWRLIRIAMGTFGRGPESVPDATEELRESERELKKRYFSAHVVEGFIFGTAERIEESAQSRAQAAYFGRDSGRLFANYAIAQGDAPRIAEVIGGLFMSVGGYAPVDNGTASQVGAWGLAPILAAPQPQKDRMSEAGLEGAVEKYEERMRAGNDQIPFGETVSPGDEMTGLVVALFGGGSPNGFANILANVLVRDAVRVDGNSSILLGQGGVALQGRHMNEYKRYYNRWGYMWRQG
jgi:hypothetical protein